jgi:hypothetical protein
MKTLATEKLPEIEWERGQLQELHERIYEANGISEDNRQWNGLMQGDEVFDIELKQIY